MPNSEAAPPNLHTPFHTLIFSQLARISSACGATIKWRGRCNTQLRALPRQVLLPFPKLWRQCYLLPLLTASFWVPPPRHLFPPPMHAMCCHTCVEQGACCLITPRLMLLCMPPTRFELPWLSRLPPFPATMASPSLSLPAHPQFRGTSSPPARQPSHTRRHESLQTQHALLISWHCYRRLLSNPTPLPQ